MVAQTLLSQSQKPPNRASWADQPKYKSDSILVRFRPGVSASRVSEIHGANHSAVLRAWSSVQGLQLVGLPAGISVSEALRTYRRNAEVLYAEPNYVVHALINPNDPKFPQQWALQNTGQMSGTTGADIHATQAWNITNGSPNVVVAVIDTGLDYNHQDLSANAWTSTGAFSGTPNGVTVNCPIGTHGYNAVANTCDPMDDNGHGTHVSGTIGAAGNNGVGVVGVNWSVRILPCKFLDANGSGPTDAAITCLDFVKAMKDQGVNIVATNNSWGGGGFSQALSDAIQAQQQDGILFIAAAGNDSANNDLDYFYPAGYFLPNIISVAATTRFDWLADFSDTGLHSVSLGAPGQEILSTIPNNSYAWLSGTSMATPHVTGVAALLAAQDPSRDWRAIKNLLLAGGDTIPSLTQTISGKRLNAYGSMTCSNSTIGRRLQPTLDTIAATTGTPIALAALHINCAQPEGVVTVTVMPGNETITLADGGVAPDQAANDGIYTGQWTPPGIGNYELTFSTGDSLQVTVLNKYTVGTTIYNYQTITGTNLNFGDDDLATLNLPFSLQFGGAGFSTVYVSSNGTISFSNAFDDFLNFAIPVNSIENMNPQTPPPPALLQPIVTLVAPYWMDLYPVKGTTQNVFWAITGSAPNRQLVVEWRNVRSFLCRDDSSANVTFEAVFSENTSNVIFNYANAAFGGACASQDNGKSASIGLQVTQNVGSQWGLDKSSVASGTALLWTPQTANAAANLSQSPAIASISPTSIPVGSYGFSLTINGSGFTPGTSIATFNGQDGQTTFVSPSELVFAVTNSMVQASGTVDVQVRTGPNTLSNTVPFTITPASAPATLQAPLTQSGTEQNKLTNAAFASELLTARFLGWKAARFLGPAYTAKYQRELARLAPSLPSTSGVPRAMASSVSSAAGTSPAAASFNFRPTLPAGFLPTAVVSGDFNRDGHLDWAVANGGDNSIWVYFGNGDGTAKLPTIIRLQGYAPVALVAADMNGDGKLDLVVAEADSIAVAVLLGNGDGTFGPELTFTTPSTPISLAVADFNGDGKPDVVVGLLGNLYSGRLAFLAGDGTGKLGLPVTHYEQGLAGISYTLAVVAADLNGDGLPDIVAVDFSIFADGLLLSDQSPGSGARIYLNRGDGTFKATQQFFQDASIDQYPPAGLAVTAVAVGDVNHDGCIDAVTLDSAGSATFFPGLCDGTFDTGKTRILGAGIMAAAAALVDVNGDGKLDLISSASPFSNYGFSLSAPASSISIQLGDGTGNFGIPALFRGEPQMVSLVVADLKKNGRPEIITANQQTDTISVYQNDGTGDFGPPKGGYLGYLTGGLMHAVGNAPFSNFAAVDLNGDGHPDLASLEVGSQGSGVQMTVMLNNGSGGFGAPIRTAIGPDRNQISDFVFADFRNTGRKDLLFVGPPASGTTYLTFGFAASNGDGTFQQPVVQPLTFTIYTPLRLAVGDFNRDGKLDFLIIGAAGYMPFLGNGDGTFTQGATVNFPFTASQGVYCRGAVVADVNGDGKPDVLILGQQTVNTPEQFPLYELLGNGDGTFQAPKLLVNSLGPFAVVDLNKDGHPDIIAAVDQGLSPAIFGHLWVYEVFIGNGDGSFTPGQTYGPFPNPYADFYYAEYFYGPADRPFGSLQPMIGDFNGDGITDLAVYSTAGTNVFNSIGYAGAPLSTQVFVLTGNGDGTFTVPSLGQGLGGLNVPQTAADLNGDGRTDLIEMDSYTSAFTVLTTGGPTFTVGLVSDPVIGPTGKLRIILNLPSNSATTLQVLASDPNISIPASVALPAGTVSQDVTFQIGASYNNSHVFALTAQLGTESHTAYGTQEPSGANAGFITAFQLATTPVITAGQTTPDYGLLIGSIGGYSTQIAISCQGLPAGASCQIEPNPVGLPAGGIVSATFTVATQSGILSGQHSFTASFTDGAVTQTAPLAFDVGDFAMSLSPGAQTVGATGSASFTLNVQGIDGYSQAVQITCSGLPQGTACPFSAPVTLGANNFQINTRNATPGTYSFTLAGSSNGITHSVVGQLTVTSTAFTGSVSPNSAMITVGTSQNFSVQVTGSGGFQGQVNLSCTTVSGLTCQLTPNQVTLLVNGAASSTLQITVNSKPALIPFVIGVLRRPPTQLIASVLLIFLIIVVADRARLLRDLSPYKPAWSSILLLTGLVTVLLTAVSCGGGSGGGGGGNGGGGGGGTTVTSVTVNGTAGGATVSFGAVSVTVP